MKTSYLVKFVLIAGFLGFYNLSNFSNSFIKSDPKKRITNLLDRNDCSHLFSPNRSFVSMPDTCCTGECCGEGLHGRNRTCIFRDLVYHNKDFSLFRSNIETDFQDRHMTFLVTRGPCRKHVCKNLSDPWMWQKPFVPRQRSESQSEPNLAKMCSNVVGISFYIAGCTSFNFGHAMWDCLYPAFLSMTLTGVVRAPWNVDFRLVFSGNDDFVDLRSKLFMEVFSGKEILELKKIVSNKCLRFEYMVVGIGDKGHMTRNEYYESQLYARHYLDDSKSVSPLHIFRKRLFCRYQLPVPERRFCEFKQTCVINVTVIRNKRFFTDLDGLCRVVNGVTNWSSLNRSNILFRCTILDWAVQRSLKEQLKFLSWQNIYYSSVGTALMSQAFLPYGSVVVNTGYLNGFWEDFHTAAIPWLQAVYPSRFGPVTVPEALDLIRKASSVWLSRFEVPIIRSTSLSPFGLIMKELISNYPYYNLINGVWDGLRCIGFDHKWLCPSSGEWNGCISNRSFLSKLKHKYGATKMCR